MPVYCYSTKDGVTVERVFPMGKAPKTVKVKGKIARRDYGAERPNVPSSNIDTWPMKPCLGSGVHPSQAQELRDHFKKHGVPTEVAPCGGPVYRDKAHRERALGVRNLHDRN